MRNLLKNHCLAKSISDASWYLFRQWIEYFAEKFGKIAVAVPPHYTSQKCSECSAIVKKSLSTRTHVCSCGCELHRDLNAALNILNLARDGQSRSNATGVVASTLVGAIQQEQVTTLIVESLYRYSQGVSISQFGNWVEQNLELGEGFDSSTFVLPSGAKRSRNGQVPERASPDAAWVAREQWDALTRKEQDGYPPLCPDFVIELRSPTLRQCSVTTDSLEELQTKMQEYVDNGVRLGWLINPQDQQVEIYRSR